MKNNAAIHLVLNSEQLQKFKKKAKDEGVSLSELCRQRVIGSSQLDRIEDILKKMLKNVETNSNK